MHVRRDPNEQGVKQTQISGWRSSDSGVKIAILKFNLQGVRQLYANFFVDFLTI